MVSKRTTRASSVAWAIGLAWVPFAWAQAQPGHGRAETAGAPQAPAIIRTTMRELHAQGGVPRGWKFLMPTGDPAEGRKVFAMLECFACHEVKGETFQEPKTSRGAGPELTGMGVHHPAEYFAESIVNPNRVIVQGPGYTGADGLSKMPSYADAMTVKQLIDVVAYLKSLTAGGPEPGGHTTGDHMKMK